MRSNQLNRWLTLGANLGVLIGILFLAAEIGQTNTIAKAEVRNSLTQSVYTLLEMQRDPRQIAVLERADEDWESLSTEERILLSSFASAIFRHYENAYYQHEYGVYETEQFAAEIADLDDSLATPFLALYWENGRWGHGAKFQDYVEQRKALLTK